MSESLRKLAIVEYGASPKGIRADHTTHFKIYGTGGCVGYAKEFLFEGPLIVVARKGTLNNPIYSDANCWVIDTAYAVIPKPEINPKWLYYQLSNFDLTRLNEATGVPSINRDFLYRTRFYKVSPSEQKKIASILSTCDAVIEKTQEAIAKYKAIKEGMLQDLFTRGIDINTGKLRPRYEDAPDLYKPSKLGWIPKEWEEKELGDVGEVRMCRRVFNYETKDKGDIPFYKIGTFGKVPDAYISKELYDNYRQKFAFPKKGDILISAAGTIGRTIIYDGTPSYFQDSNIVWIDNNGTLISNEYLYQVFQIVKFKTEGGTIQRLYNSILESGTFPRPPKTEQEKITAKLTAIDNQLHVEQAYLKKMQQIKKGLMEDLLTGRKEVKVEEKVLANEQG